MSPYCAQGCNIPFEGLDNTLPYLRIIITPCSGKSQCSPGEKLKLLANRDLRTNLKTNKKANLIL
jgi:hypothetical protein